jgi:hypothetical protein
MTKSKAYLLENKDYQPIITDIENHAIGHTLRYHIAVFKWYEHRFAIVASHELVQAMAVKHGAIELANDDTLKKFLQDHPEDHDLLYGERGLAKFIEGV